MLVAEQAAYSNMSIVVVRRFPNVHERHYVRKVLGRSVAQPRRTLWPPQERCTSGRLIGYRRALFNTRLVGDTRVQCRADVEGQWAWP